MKSILFLIVLLASQAIKANDDLAHIYYDKRIDLLLEKEDYSSALAYYTEHRDSISHLARYNLATTLAYKKYFLDALDIYQYLSINTALNDELAKRVAKNSLLIIAYLNKNLEEHKKLIPKSQIEDSKTISLSPPKNEPMLPTNSFEFFLKQMR